MQLIELPTEILHLILFYAVSNRGAKRALRLRVVCKTFRRGLYPALFETHILDDRCGPCGNAVGSKDWQFRHQHGADKLWQRYLSYRVLIEGSQNTLPGPFTQIRQFAEIPQVAHTICQEQEHTLDLNVTVEELCRLTTLHGTVMTRDMFKWWHTWLKGPAPPAGLTATALLSAAAHFDLLPLAIRLLDEGFSPVGHNYVFAPPIQVAAHAGNIAMLELFRSRLSKTTFEPFSVIGAAIRGDLEVIKIIMQQSDDTGPLRLGCVSHSSDTGQAIIHARSYTSVPEVFDYLTSYLDLTASPQRLLFWHNDLRDHAGLGNTEMIRHLLRLGVPVQQKDQGLESPLRMACENGHNDVVDLLLEYGADPNFEAQKSNPAYPLHNSGMAGNLRLTQRLLDAGATINLPQPENQYTTIMPILWWAFAREHTALIRLLIDRGASLQEVSGSSLTSLRRKQAADSVCGMVYTLGLESMAELLREYGFNIDASRKKCAKTGQFWHRWAEAKAVLEL
ncbi:ankyrin [Cadophora sp. DSE1049]|nr:ankyrin [Cadophora sp. DSE1049]